MEQFASKIDTWLLLVLVIAIGVSIGATLFSIGKGGMTSYIAALALLSVGAAVPIWIFLSTHYTVTTSELLVRSGPFSWTIPLASITSVQETRSSWSSPALSLDRLRIDYANGNYILVSPKDKKAFRTAIGHPQN